MVDNFSGIRVIDLTKRIVPGQMGRRCEIRTTYSANTDDYTCDIDTMSHLGTHLESPKHWNQNWKDVADFPASHFLGRCVMLKISDIEPAGKITADHMNKADGGRVHEGDIVLVDTPYHLPPFSFPDKEIRPHVNAEMGHWLVGRGVKLLGFSDGIDIETNVQASKEFHEVAMAHDICFLEVLENFDKIEEDVFFLIALPLPFEGLDSCPVRAVAIEGLAF